MGGQEDFQDLDTVVSSHLKGIRGSCSGVVLRDHGLGTQIYVTLSSIFQHRSGLVEFYSFREQRKSRVETNLKYIGGYARELATER